jgi:EAL domain-containing protein (putative c-di-GMP-specific phosphodiesterase class I)
MEEFEVAAGETRLQLSNDLRCALAAGQFEVYLQPIVELATDRILKAEALLRWHHPQLGMVGPGQFIPIAEETGLINEIGDWVFRECARVAKACHDAAENAAAAPLQISVNKSPRQFFSGNTHENWIEHLAEIGLPPSCMVIEITEGLLLDDRPEVAEKLLRFRRADIQISLDDFGTGYSAMGYLKKFPIDFLKIDQSFVRGMATDPSDLAIVEAIIVMAHKLGLKVIAEGVETAEQRDLLQAAGCDYGQGYLFARPMPVAELASIR